MSKVSEWIEAVKVSEALKPASFQASGSGFRAHFATGPMVVVTNPGILDKADALAFSEWIRKGLVD